MIDNQIIINSISGDSISQTKLYNLITKSFYNLVKKYTKCNSEIMDILHNSYMKIINKFNTLKDINYFWGWSKQIVHNEAVSFIRNKKIYNTLSYLEENLEAIKIYSNTLEINESTISIEKYKILHESIEKLSPRRKEIVSMYLVQGMKQKEISKKLKISLGTVKSNYKRGLDVLKDIVLKNYKEE